MNIRQTTKKATELEYRVVECGVADARDLAQAQELVNQYIDELQRLEETATVKPYLLADTVANKILSRWYPNG